MCYKHPCLQQIKTIRQHAHKITNRLFDETDVSCKKREEVWDYTNGPIRHIKAGTSDKRTKVLLEFLNRNSVLKITRSKDYLGQNIRNCHVAERAPIQVITVKIPHGVYNLKVM